jgi:hypothetical protein
MVDLEDSYAMVDMAVGLSGPIMTSMAIVIVIKNPVRDPGRLMDYLRHALVIPFGISVNITMDNHHF